MREIDGALPRPGRAGLRAALSCLPESIGVLTWRRGGAETRLLGGAGRFFAGAAAIEERFGLGRVTESIAAPLVVGFGGGRAQIPTSVCGM